MGNFLYIYVAVLARYDFALLRHIQIVRVTYGAGASVAFAIGLASAEFAIDANIEKQ
jgi:hypothetical protein